MIAPDSTGKGGTADVIILLTVLFSMAQVSQYDEVEAATSLYQDCMQEKFGAQADAGVKTNDAITVAFYLCRSERAAVVNIGAATLRRHGRTAAVAARQAAAVQKDMDSELRTKLEVAAMVQSLRDRKAQR